jgi:hypothetical protein
MCSGDFEVTELYRCCNPAKCSASTFAEAMNVYKAIPAIRKDDRLISLSVSRPEKVVEVRSDLQCEILFRFAIAGS